MAIATFAGVSPVYAAAAAAPAATTVQEASEPNAVSFTDKIHSIINEWEATRTSSNTVRRASAESNLEVVTAGAAAAPDKAGTDTTTIDAGTMAGPMADETFSFDWQNTPLPQTLYAISKVSGKQIVINGKLDGTVYTSLHGVTYSQALDYLANIFNFNWMPGDDGTILISTSDLMKQSKVFHIDYADKTKVKEEIKALGVDDKSIYVNDDYGTISVTGTPYQLAAVQRKLTAIDHPVQQCLIIAQLISVSHGSSLNLGMQYTLPTYSHTADSSGSSSSSASTNGYGRFIDKLSFSMSSEASKAMSHGKVISRPMILVKNGQQADVYFGDSVPVLTSTTTTASTNITVEYKDIGTKLQVTPSILRGGEVNMDIHAEISNISKWTTQGSVSAPQISSRKANTVAHIRSGESMVIGGLMSVSDIDNLSGIPGLMDLPILGNLFKYHSKSKEYTEIFIMITPYIVTEGLDPQALLRKVN